MNIFPDDTFITSYPKSGNTWARFFLANLLRGDSTTDFTNLDQVVPDIAKVDRKTLENLPRPRFLKSHQPYTAAYPKVLYLVRDVRAVVTSYYRQRLRMGVIPAGLGIADFVRMFIEGSITQFGPWDEHITGWIDNGQDRQHFHLVRYEDMLLEGPVVFRRIAEFLGTRRSDTDIERACALSTFQRMRQLEEQAGRAWPEKRAAVDLRIPFMYAGQADSWRSELDAVSRQLIEDRFGKLLSRLGYLL